ncbi:hypothetical protein ACQKJ1_26345 [Methylorubrum rhodesianum]|uniref:hypothetical protein n=1 Tax=Methylorubrum rhodesianum TaxID=29427 RepID=UPI003D06AF39
MLKTLLAFAGFTPAPPKRPPSRRRVAPTAAPAVAPVVLDAEARARRNAALRARADALPGDPNFRFAQDVATVVRTYDPHSSQPSAEQLQLALCRLGDVGTYVRAVYIGGARMTVLAESLRSDRARTRAYREHVESLARTDLDRWEAGAIAADRAANEARRYGNPQPAPLSIPEEIRTKLDARAIEKARRLAEQAARRNGGGGTTGGSAGPTGSAPAAPPALPLAPAGKGDEETPEGSEPPVGPKR